jgi:SAM-dependent methyltransferase
MNIQRKIKNLLPGFVIKIAGTTLFIFWKNYYKVFPRPCRPAETSKAKKRRMEEGFFEKYCQGNGLDIGYGGDLLCPNCKGWDIEDGDAQTLEGLPDNHFDFVYSSHCLEHVNDAADAISNWWRVLKPGGYLILYIPERDLYERKKTLPSRWNTSHKRFFLLDKDELPDTVGILPLIEKTLENYTITKAELCKQNYKLASETSQASGEYSIEVILKKI